MTREDAIRERILAATQSTDLHELLNHLAWTDVLRPALEAESAFNQQMLVDATLGQEPTIRDTNGIIHKLTREQLAGRIHGIRHVIGIIERILRKGDKALEEITKLGYNIE